VALARTSGMRLAEIWYAEEGSAPMQRTETIRAVDGGLAGDRVPNRGRGTTRRSTCAR